MRTDNVLEENTEIWEKIKGTLHEYLRKILGNF